MERKTITIPSHQERVLQALANNENGADWDVLLNLSALVVHGMEIDPDFQKVANAIVAQAVLNDRLPPKKRGRPKNTDGTNGLRIANYYFDLRDGGTSYADAVAKTAEKFSKDERHIMRLVRENKSEIGNTKPEREHGRAMAMASAKMRALIGAQNSDSPGARVMGYYEHLIAKKAALDPQKIYEECMDDLDDKIDEVLSRRFPTDMK